MLVVENDIVVDDCGDDDVLDVVGMPTVGGLVAEGGLVVERGLVVEGGLVVERVLVVGGLEEDVAD